MKRYSVFVWASLSSTGTLFDLQGNILTWLFLMCKFWSFGGVFPSPNSDWLVINKQLYDIFFHVSLPQNSRTMQRSVLKKAKSLLIESGNFA